MQNFPPGPADAGTDPRGPGAVTRAMVHARTRELALRAGRTAMQISQQDYEAAKRELTGESDSDRQDALLDASTPHEAAVGSASSDA